MPLIMCELHTWMPIIMCAINVECACIIGVNFKNDICYIYAPVKNTFRKDIRLTN